MSSAHYSVNGPERCPSCGSKRVVPIVYGLPGPEAIAEAERGEISLGGCIPSWESWECLDCRTSDS